MNYFPTIRQGTNILLFPNNKIFINLSKNNLPSIPKERRDISITIDAWTILQYCNGKNSIKKILNILNYEYDLSEEYLLNFLHNMADINIIKINKQSTKAKFNIFGDGTKYFPQHVSFRITERCNLNCTYCYMGKSNSKIPFTNINKVENILDIMKNNFINTVELTGGEPMMYPEIFKVIKYTLSNFSFVSILTNGVHFPDKIIKYISNFRDKIFIQISIDGSNEKISSVMRQAKRTSAKTIETITKMIINKIPFRVAMVIDFYNVHDIENVIIILKKLGVKNIVLTFSNEIGNAERIDSNTNTLFLDIISQHGEYISEIVSRYDDIVNVELSEMDQNLILNTRNCGAGTKSVVVDHRGNVFPCPMLYEGAGKMGNILHDNYFDIFNKSKLSKICRNFSLKSTEDLSCKGCEYSNYCSSCFTKVHISNKHRIKRNLDLCEVAKKYKISEIAIL